MPSAQARYERWVRDLDRIYKQVRDAHLYRHLWRELAEMTQAVELPPSVIFDAFGIWYSTTQTAFVRRQLDRRRGVVSLIRLLEDIARNPDVMTRERHVALWTSGGDEHFEEPGHRNFDRFSGGRGSDRLDLDLVRADIATLNEVGRVVERYVNEAIAHTADETTHEIPTFADLNAAIDTIGDLFKKYSSLLKAEWVPELVPVIQYDWKAPFRQPWMSPRGV